MRAVSILLLLILLSSCKQTDQPLNEGYYRVYINNDRIDYMDATTGETIYSEFVNWERPTKLQQAIINDKK